MNLWVDSQIFTDVKRNRLSPEPSRKHTIGMRLTQHRAEELALLEKLRAEAKLPSPLA